MAFRIPKPRYDAEVVAQVELHLRQDALTIKDGEGPVDPDTGLCTTTYRGRQVSGITLYVRPMFEILDPVPRTASRQMSAVGCPDCDDWSRTAHCSWHADVPPVSRADQAEAARRMAGELSVVLSVTLTRQEVEQVMNRTLRGGWRPHGI